ncbi:MAG TPA: glycine--tRNA ligase subunit beta [Phenylobacterium sp.]|jgi:glycyl-tRNA synthetase beta chain|uniref:glycine--tRNA ligase subunit beta n=1 Tax=Phenylobacterium sp. TaxID=1871053 RepID=UPI002BC4ED74|nr:glycine--tRNA ligase subunit beta [Phenylobacterium sp.]HXA40040.1 glycine--tRNA ligase subunit beta [Phenylobacterium sp.]
MPQLLLELFSEEIPARMQAGAARDLERLAREKLAAEGLLPEALKTFAGPRRLTLVAEGLAASQPDRHEERKGPRVGAPDQAIDGFLRSTGLTRDQLTERDGVYFAHLHKAGRPTAEIIAEMVDGIVRGFPWPKSMVSGTSKLRWVRPLQRILCVFDGQVVPFEIDGHVAGDLTEGHRFMGSGQAFHVRDFDAYADGLARNFVVLDPEERKERILDAARTLCFARNFELVEDEGLLDEVSGLAEWPTPVMGDMDPAFLDLPPEVIRTSMRVHQRFFAVRDPMTGFLVPHFITVANIEATDGGKLIASGNARVLSARLSDARFFWNEDLRVRLEDRLEKLKGVTFHAKLGTMYERIERIVALAGELAPFVRDDEATKALAQQAALLCKADLTSGMVGEFPELQGIMGGYYAEKQGLEPEIVDAIRWHYKPQGPNDDVPVQAVAATVALADKLDTLVSFFAIDEKPTGSRDPYALRRAALGVIRILLGTRARLGLRQAIHVVYEQVRLQNLQSGRALGEIGQGDPTKEPIGPQIQLQMLEPVQRDLSQFLADRLKVLLREQGERHDLVDAVFALGDDDIVRIVSKVNALSGFLGTEDGKNLLAGYKRAVNILKAEEKKGPLPSGEPNASAPGEEGALTNAVGHMQVEVGKALDKEDYAAAMGELAKLREPVDAFFDKVLVNSDVAAERENRLRLLVKVRDAMGRVADFSQITG